VTLVGGHTEITFGLSRPILVGHMLGITTEAGLLMPGGTGPGDRLLLTKGIAIEGTALLARELGTRLAHELGAEFVDDAQRLLVNPGISVTTDARVLLRAGGVTALHDPTEGGLAMGVRELALAAGCGIRLDRTAVRVLPATKRLADHLALDPMGMLASGSLLASVEPDAVEIAVAACQRAGIPVTEIGVAVEASEGLTWHDGGDFAPLPQFAADEVSRVLADCDFGVGC
jgi:hydrogenase expression/formation protein HypE